MTLITLGATASDDNCYKQFNVAGAFNGHCGHDDATGDYLKCSNRFFFTNFFAVASIMSDSFAANKWKKSSFTTVCLHL